MSFPFPLLPAERAPQSGVMLTWPHRHGDWGSALAGAEAVFLTLAREIARRETLLAVCFDAAHRDEVRGRLEAGGVAMDAVILAIAPSNDSWARDHGPLTVLVQGRPRLVDFRFNGWGGKYPADLDDAVTARLHAQGVFGSTPLESVDLVLEGGAIDSDGQGGLLATRRCLLSPARNAGMDAAQMEARLRRHLGARQVRWLEHGALEGDDTDGHVDMLVRFAGPDTLVYQACDEPDYGAYAELRALEAELAGLRTRKGQPYRLVGLPWPAPVHDDDGRRLPASYANFLPVNGAVLVPAYEDPRDDEAAAVLAGLFPDRDIVPVPCRPLLYQNGSLHCATLQFPAGVELQPPVTG